MGLLNPGKPGQRCPDCKGTAPMVPHCPNGTTCSWLYCPRCRASVYPRRHRLISGSGETRTYPA